jgi:ribonuclease HI
MAIDGTIYVGMGIFNAKYSIVESRQLLTEHGYSSEYQIVITAELYAIYEAVNIISRLPPSEYMVATDSSFALNSIKYLNCKKNFHVLLAGLIRNKILAMADNRYIVELSKVEAHKCDESALSASNQAANILAGIAATGIMWAPTVKPAIPEPDTAIPKGICGPCRKFSGKFRTPSLDDRNAIASENSLRTTHSTRSKTRKSPLYSTITPS